jgi:hypothetical protein
MDRKILGRAGRAFTVGGLVGGVLGISGPAFHPLLFTSSMGMLLAGTVVAGLSGRRRSAALPGGPAAAPEQGASTENLARSLEELAHRLDERQVDAQEVLDKVGGVLVCEVPALLSYVKGLGGVVTDQERAGLISLISEAERYLNRTWSALTDGYREEARASLREARARYGEVLSCLSRLHTEEPPAAPEKSAADGPGGIQF